MARAVEGSRALGVQVDEAGSTQGCGSLCVPSAGQREPSRELLCPVHYGESCWKVRLRWAVHGGPTETASASAWWGTRRDCWEDKWPPGWVFEAGSLAWMQMPLVVDSSRVLRLAGPFWAIQTGSLFSGRVPRSAYTPPSAGLAPELLGLGAMLPGNDHQEQRPRQQHPSPVPVVRYTSQPCMPRK